jgi:hypothetical protein
MSAAPAAASAPPAATIPSPAAIRSEPVSVPGPTPEAAAEAAAATDSSGIRLRVTGGGGKWVMRALAGFAALALLEGAVIAWLITRDSGGGGLLATGELLVQSRPAAARVSIDGEEVGITPLSTTVSPGTHILELRVGRSEARVIPIQVRAGVQTGFYVELQSVSNVGALDVRSDPPKARVSVDGQFRGVTPIVIRELPPGDHEILIEAGSRQVRQTVRVEPGITAQLVVPLGR